MSYLYLCIAISLEVIGTLILPTTHTFTKPLPSLGVVICYSLAFYFLALTLKTIPVAIAYATWSAVGVFAIAIFGYLIYAQALQWQAVLGLALIITGVLLVNLYHQPH